jgi:two-component sensor histidine kinase
MVMYLLRLHERRGAAWIVGVICVAIAFSIQSLLASYTKGMAPPFLAFFPAIVVSTLVGGAATGWPALIVSALLAWRFLFPYSVGTAMMDLPRLLILALFLLSGSVIVLIASAYRRSLEQAEQDRQALQSGEAQARLVHQAAKIGTWEYDIAGDRVIWSPDMFRLYDLDPSAPTPTIAEWRARVQLDGKPEDHYNLRRDLRKSGETLDRELRILTFRGRTRWLIGRSVAVGVLGEAPTRFIGVNIDITAQKASEERERLLAHELDHRAKNMLAMVQSVVQLTRGERVPEFRQAVIGRIQSLARSHSLLAASRWEGADLMHLVRDELEPFMNGEHAEIRAIGPRVKLHPAAAQTLALLIHELATNAVKYGALSIETGRLSVDWALASSAGNADLVLSWIETGGPSVKIPDHRGFGSRLIATSVERQFHGAMVMNWHATGLHCEVTIPAVHLIPASGEDTTEITPPAKKEQPEAGIATGDAQNILVVEDETLIAMQIEQALTQAGYRVIGPVARLSEAPEAIANGALEGAVLDINLGGERSFAIADLLMSRRVPFMFCTGFAASSILPDRFRDIPVIIKPFSVANLLKRLEETIAEGPADHRPTRSAVLQAD